MDEARTGGSPEDDPPNIDSRKMGGAAATTPPLSENPIEKAEHPTHEQYSRAVETVTPEFSASTADPCLAIPADINELSLLEAARNYVHEAEEVRGILTQSKRRCHRNRDVRCINIAGVEYRQALSLPMNPERQRKDDDE